MGDAVAAVEGVEGLGDALEGGEQLRPRQAPPAFGAAEGPALPEGRPLARHDDDEPVAVVAHQVVRKEPRMADGSEQVQAVAAGVGVDLGQAME